MTAKRILLVEDHPVMRRSIRAMLSLHSELAIVGEADDGAGAIRQARELKIDLILLDLNLQDMDGIQVAKRLIEITPNLPIIILSLYDDAKMVAQCKAAGTKGYVCKSDIGRDLFAAIHAVSQNQLFFN